MVLATSRAPLHLAAEHELPVEPLPTTAAVELFVTRAAAAGRAVDPDETVAALCRRLDNLPLALELAAARTKLLSPTALFQRLDHALALLTTGAADAPERQQTLRATIAWSHDLLDPAEQTAFRRASLFRGSFTVEAAEAVTGAGLDQIATLLDQSLLKSTGDDRLFMLQTLREYAREQLDEAGEIEEHALGHARWYLARLEAIEPARRGPRAREFLAWYAEEEDNLRAMLDRLKAAPAEAARAACLLVPYWKARGQFDEGQIRLRGLLADDLSPGARALLLSSLAEIEVLIGHLDDAEAAAVEAAELAEEIGDGGTLATALMAQAHVAHRRPTQAEDAVSVARRALEHAGAVDDGLRAVWLNQLGLFMTATGQGEEARSTLRQAVEAFRRLGDWVNEANTTSNLAWIDLHDGAFESARAGYATALALSRQVGHRAIEMAACLGAGKALLGLNQREAARAELGRALELAKAAAWLPGFYAVEFVALSAEPSDLAAAARVVGSAAKLRLRDGLTREPRDDELQQRFEQLVAETHGSEAWKRERDAADLSLEEAIALAGRLAPIGEAPTLP